jgi:hypothetical protein
MKKLLQVLNILGFVGVVTINALAVLLPINNKTTQALSDMYPNLFVPAGLTFSIWGVIYILLLIFTAYQAADLFGGKADRTGFIGKAGVLYLATSLLNIGWILAWHYEQVLLSVVIMLCLLAALILLYLRIGVKFRSAAERFAAQVPVAVYLGWISVAIIANVTALLVDLGWAGVGISQEIWTILMIAAATILGVLMRLLKGDIAYGLVIIWALAGISIKRLGTEPVVLSVAYAAMCGAAIVLLSFLVRNKKVAGC